MDTTQNKEGESFRITGDWDLQSKQLKERFSQLTAEDLHFETGKENELIGRIGTRLNKKPEEVIDMIRKSQAEKA